MHICLCRVMSLFRCRVNFEILKMCVLKVEVLCGSYIFPLKSESHSAVSDSVIPWALQSMEFFMPRIEPRSPTLQADSLPAEPPWKQQMHSFLRIIK